MEVKFDETGQKKIDNFLAHYGAWKVPAVRNVVDSAGKATYSAIKNSDLTSAGMAFFKNLR